ncbi:MAG TPA: response regulator [Candidatus Binatia bacterium]|nr:response regulator [Candidatus Binatia bacterium]
MSVLDLSRVARVRLVGRSPAAEPIPKAPPEPAPSASPAVPDLEDPGARVDDMEFVAVPSPEARPSTAAAPPPQPSSSRGWSVRAPARPAAQPVPAAAEATPQVRAPARAVDPAAALAPPSVLVVDDNVRLARTVAAFMEMEGFRVQAAHSAEEALDAAGRYPFDLALVDINMPGMDGIEVCRRLREMSPAVRMILVTGRDSTEDPIRAQAVGARRLLIKPISLAALRDEMLRVLAA